MLPHVLEQETVAYCHHCKCHLVLLKQAMNSLIPIKLQRSGTRHIDTEAPNTPNTAPNLHLKNDLTTTVMLPCKIPCVLSQQVSPKAS